MPVQKRLLMLGAFAACSWLAAGSFPGLAMSGGDNAVVNLTSPILSWLPTNSSASAPLLSSGAISGNSLGHVGWLDYQIDAPKSGWYRLEGTAPTGLQRTTFRLDPDGPDAVDAFSSSREIPGGHFATGWFWIVQGAHVLRVQNSFWTGFPTVSSLTLHAADTGETGFAIKPDEQNVFPLDRCAPLKLLVGGGPAAHLTVSIRSDMGEVEHRTVNVPASSQPAPMAIARACSAAGDFDVAIGDAEGKPVTAHASYSVINDRPIAQTFVAGDLIDDIDVSRRTPDYSGCETRVVSSGFDSYRESGDQGTTPFARSGGRTLKPCWFAYRLHGLTIGMPYRLQVEYPDDQRRVFVVAVRDAATRNYPPSVGIETGGAWPHGSTPGSSEILFWPESSDSRVIIANVHTGLRAAANRIKINAEHVTANLPPPPPVNNRRFELWYEEGDNFRTLVGQSAQPQAIAHPVDRFMALAANSGASDVVPSAAVYTSMLFPSRVAPSFADGRDTLTAMMLSGQRYGLRVIPELAPRADELLWPFQAGHETSDRLALSADGSRRYRDAQGALLRPPLFNALDPWVQRWYIALIGEMADRYASYAAFSGVRLRIMPFWQNSGLNNLVSLDWGYDATTVERFFRDTDAVAPQSLDIRSDSPAATSARHAVLISRYRSAWIAWRCEQMRYFYARIVDRVRHARKDLDVSLALFNVNDEPKPSATEEYREIGIDPALLKTIPGLDIVDARIRYGAREADPKLAARQRAETADSGSLTALSKNISRPHVLMTMDYQEIPGMALPGRLMGAPPEIPEFFISAASNPPYPWSMERMARVVGLTDALTLGDGGNGYIFGDDRRRAFVNAYRCLPATPFATVLGTPADIAIRAHGDWMYLVNLTDHTAKTDLKVEGGSALVEGCSANSILLNGNVASIELAPYQLRVFHIATGQRLTGITPRYQQ